MVELVRHRIGKKLQKREQKRLQIAIIISVFLLLSNEKTIEIAMNPREIVKSGNWGPFLNWTVIFQIV